MSTASSIWLHGPSSVTNQVQQVVLPMLISDGGCNCLKRICYPAAGHGSLTLWPRHISANAPSSKWQDAQWLTTAWHFTMQPF